MQLIEEFLAKQQAVTVHTVASYVRQYLAAQWRPTLEGQGAELERVFAQAGEWAYGVYGRALLRPLRDRLAGAGFQCTPDFPGDFAASVEHWGPPEERERCLWSVLQNAQGETLGTLVIRLYHDHTRFRLPDAPGVLALEVTDEAGIRAALADAGLRRPPNDAEPEGSGRRPGNQTSPAWEYSVEIGLADCLDASRPEVSESLLDLALARWARYGWELVSVVPQGKRLLAFFRRAGGRT